jgi:hypothetical protein
MEGNMKSLKTDPDLKLFERQAEAFSLIPLNGKRPIEEGWQQWCKTKREFNRRDFEGHNAGVCCGPASGVLVLDVDDPEAFEALLESNGDVVPKTFTVMTGSDKPHYYFNYPAGGVTIGNKSFKHPLFSRHTIYDVRGVGGQVVAAGSVHPDTGKLYRVEKHVAIAPPPPWLLSMHNGDAINVDGLLEVPLPEPKDTEFVESLRVSQDTKDFILRGVPRGGRSETGMSVINALFGAGYDDRMVFFIFNHYAIGDKYREKGASRTDWLRGEIGRSRQYLTAQRNTQRQATLEQPPEQNLEEVIQELNEKHAVIMIGGRCLVMNEIFEPVFKRPDVTFSSPGDFNLFYRNQKIRNPERGNPEFVSKAKVWLDSPDRREYKGIVFSPDSPERDVDGYYNMYRGFAIDPKAGDWSLFKHHIREVLAGDDDEIFGYIIAWMAHLVQHPGGERPGTAIVLRGKQGTGKGCFATQFGKIFGSHFLHVTNQRQLTGRFNNHLKDALLVFCDEGIWAGDKAAEGVLKAMITEDQNLVEPKGKDVFQVKNFIRLIVASNNDWVVPAGLEERRFFVLDISDKYMQNHEYFKKLFDQMDKGGREAMLHDLLQFDLTGINLRSFPRTEALMDQIENSMTPVQKYWYDRLSEGTVRHVEDEWTEAVLKEDLYKEYIEFAKRIGGRYLLSESQFGKEIRKLCPQIDTKKLKGQGHSCGGRRPHYIFPPLDECRTAFENQVNLDVKWSYENEAQKN